MNTNAFIRRAGALAATLALALTSTLGLSACGGPKPEEVIKQQVKLELDTIKQADADTIKSVLGEDEWNNLSSSGMDVEQFYNGCVKHFSYEDPTVEVDGDNATVTIPVTNVDIAQVFETWTADALNYASSEEAQADYAELGEDGIAAKLFEKLYTALGADDAPIKTADVQIDFTKDSDGSWNPTDSDQLGSLLFAGVDPSTIG